MPEYTLKCPRCRKSSKISRCPNCGSGARHLFIETYSDGSVRGLSCRKCGMTRVSHHCPKCGMEYNPAILRTPGCLGCPTQILLALLVVAVIATLVGAL